MIPLSLVVITKNEEANIGRCLASVPFAAEKLVLDSGSSDKTVELAKSQGAKVFVEQWRGYFQQKTRACELAAHPWILSLDADEALSPECASEIQKILQSEPQSPAYAFSRLSFHLGRWIRHGGWFPDWQVRLFDKRQAHWQPGELHERVTAPKVERVSAPLLHWVFSDLSDQVATNNHYSTLGAQEIVARGGRFSLLKLLFKPWGKFIETYVIKRGFLDGLPGFIIAVGAAYSMFLKMAKVWESKRPQTSTDPHQNEPIQK